MLHFYKMCTWFLVKRHNFANTQDLFAFVQDFFWFDNFIYNRISRFDLTLRKNQFESKNAKFIFHAFQLKPLVMHTQITKYINCICKVRIRNANIKMPKMCLMMLCRWSIKGILFEQCILQDRLHLSIIENTGWPKSKFF